MGLFDSIFENGAVYSTNKQVNYEDKRLFVIWILFSLVFPAYLVHEALINQSYQEQPDSLFFFSISSADGLVHVSDMVVGQEGSKEELKNVAVAETDNIILVPARIISTYQVNDICPNNDLNPGVECLSNEDCIEHYNQAGATCNATTKLCNYSPYKTWCTTQKVETSLFKFQEALDLMVTARVKCGDGSGKIFSNFNRLDRSEQPFYKLNTVDLLRKAGLHTNDSFSEYFAHGLDLVVEYKWHCNLDDKHLGRYACPIQQEVHVISHTSIISREAVVVETFESADKKATRQLQTIIGFRFRMHGSGGCYQTTMNSVLQLLTQGFALDSVIGIVMLMVLWAWHKRYRVPRAEEYFRITCEDGIHSRAKLYQPEPYDEHKIMEMIAEEAKRRERLRKRFKKSRRR